MSKKGSHVGIIASFAIFVTFLAGLYFVLSPIFENRNQRDEQLKYLEESLKQEFSDNLSVVVISPISPANCSNLSLAALGFSGLDAIAKDSDGNIINSIYSSGNLFVAATSAPIIWISISPQDFLNTTTAQTDCVSPEIKSVRETKEIFETKIVEGVNNFDELKGKFNLDAGINFGFTFRYNNGTEISTPILPSEENVYIKEIKINYIDAKAQKVGGKIKLSVW